MRIAAAVFLAALALAPTAQADIRRKSGPVLILHDWYGKSPASTPSFVREHLAFLDPSPSTGWPSIRGRRTCRSTSRRR